MLHSRQAFGRLWRGRPCWQAHSAQMPRIGLRADPFRRAGRAGRGNRRNRKAPAGTDLEGTRRADHRGKQDQAAPA